MVSSTTARIVPSLVPRRVSGDILGLKLVNYTINLLPDKKIDSVIRLLLQNQPANLETINQTMYNPVRCQPIAISIETKTPDAPEQDAEVQLGVWVAAHFNRLRMLSQEDPVSLTLPLLYVSGAQWFLLFASDSAEQIVCYFLICLACQLLTFQQELLGKLLIGDTATAVGCYKLLATLRCLCGWVTTTFKEWFELKVLPGSNQ
jgi:hypothetical protein